MRAERGTAMTSTMVFLVIALLASMTAFSQLHQVIRLERSSLRVSSTSDGAAEALGLAVARLHTGIPPESPYTCRTRLRSSDGADVLAFHVTHTQLAADRWSVSAQASAVEIDDCPSAFADECPLGGP
jgi:hypothetical protein